MDALNDHRVSVYRNSESRYPETPPFHPGEDYPEYVLNGRNFLSSENSVYASFREVLHLLKLDEDHYGTSEWNPLGEIIKPGDKVVIKPNFVREYHIEGKDIFSVITHASVIRAVVDYAYIALKGKGEIVIADAPQGDAHFDGLLEKTRVDTISDVYREALNFEIPILDLRKMRYECGKSGFITRETRFELEGDPLGYAPVDLGTDSEFSNLGSYERIYGADYNRKETQKHHNKERNEYLVSRTILSSNVIISVPKLKVHKKAGVTLNLKNMIGINGDKNWLPHFRIGSPDKGGDEMPANSTGKTEHAKISLKRKLTDRFLSNGSPSGEFIYNTIRKMYRLYKSVGRKSECELKEERIEAGGWYGNDTIWRTVLDLNKILISADREGRICSTPQRRFLSIIDGIVAGEKDGPLTPDPKICGVLMAGFNPFTVDIAATKLMGFDYGKIPKFKRLLESKGAINGALPIADPNEIEVLTNVSEWEHAMSTSDRLLDFAPPKGWAGHIEID